MNDLLNGKQAVRVMEDSFGSIQLIGLREYQVEEVKPTLALLKHGYQQRTNGKTLANENSSRSHAIFQVVSFLLHSISLCREFLRYTHYHYQLYFILASNPGRRYII